jgi:hypothetical protein
MSENRIDRLHRRIGTRSFAPPRFALRRLEVADLGRAETAQPLTDVTTVTSAALDRPPDRGLRFRVSGLGYLPEYRSGRERRRGREGGRPCSERP